MGIDSNISVYFTDENGAVVKREKIHSYKCKSECELLKIPSDASHVRICYTLGDDSCDEGCKFQSDDSDDDTGSYIRSYYDLKSGKNLDFNDLIGDFYFSVYKLDNGELSLECSETCKSKIDSKMIFSKDIVETNEDEYPEFSRECEALKEHHTSDCRAIKYDIFRSNGFVPTWKRLCNGDILYKCEDCNVHVALGNKIPKHKENCNQIEHSQKNH